jgi:hypothetical protein
MENSSLAGWMAWLSSLSKCQIKPKKTVANNLNRPLFQQAICPDFFGDFLAISHFLLRIVIYRDFSDFFGDFCNRDLNYRLGHINKVTF